jgi:hypothetical protein
MKADLSIVVAKEVGHKFKNAAQHHIGQQKEDSSKVIINACDILPMENVDILDQLAKQQLSQTT